MLETKSVNSGSEPIFKDSLFARFGKATLRKQIGWHVAQAEPHAAIILITPADAEDLLKRNQGEDYHNRPVSTGTVTRYENEMSRGWRLTGETIIISRSGRLLNGQHRLLACVASGVAFRTFVAFGVADDAFAFMDKGKKRTASDIFSINGVVDSVLVAAATAWVWRYHNTNMRHASGGEAPEPDQLYSYFLTLPLFSDSAEAGRRFATKRLAAPSLMMAMHYLCAQKHRAVADAFFYAVATGENIKKTSPQYRLRDRLIDERVAGGKLSDLYVAAFTVMAWNAARANRRAPTLRWRTEQAPDLPFPAIQ